MASVSHLSSPSSIERAAAYRRLENLLRNSSKLKVISRPPLQQETLSIPLPIASIGQSDESVFPRDLTDPQLLATSRGLQDMILKKLLTGNNDSKVPIRFVACSTIAFKNGSKTILPKVILVAKSDIEIWPANSQPFWRQFNDFGRLLTLHTRRVQFRITNVAFSQSGPTGQIARDSSE